MPIIPALRKLRNEDCEFSTSLEWQDPVSKNNNKKLPEPGAVSYTCNPTYLRGRDQEDHSLRPA
jgi:hypothetical protein